MIGSHRPRLSGIGRKPGRVLPVGYQLPFDAFAKLICIVKKITTHICRLNVTILKQLLSVVASNRHLNVTDYNNFNREMIVNVIGIAQDLTFAFYID